MTTAEVMRLGEKRQRLAIERKHFPARAAGTHTKPRHKAVRERGRG